MDETNKVGSSGNNLKDAFPSNASASAGITRILPTGPQSETRKTVEGPDFIKRAEAFEGAANGIVSIVNGVPNKFLEWKASRIIEDKSDRKDLLAPMQLSPKTQDAASSALSRIFARHCESTEAADWTVLCGAAGELAVGVRIVMARLDELEKKLLDKAKNDTKQP